MTKAKSDKKVPKTRKRVLIVDDDVELAQMVKDVLESHHYEVEIANNGLEAIEKTNSFPVDVILLDIRLPIFSGIWFCDAFRKRPKTKAVPIIVISGACDESEIEKAYTVGASAFLKKPFKFDELFKILERLTSE